MNERRIIFSAGKSTRLASLKGSRQRFDCYAKFRQTTPCIMGMLIYFCEHCGLTSFF